MKKYETFGQALARLMKEKACTVKDLAQQMNLKSTNTIARLLTDKSSLNKVRSFCDELLNLNPLELVEAEKEQLREAVNVSAVGANRYLANKHMLYFMQERPQSPACICKQAYGSGSVFISTLDDLLQSYGGYESVSIMLQNCALGGVTRALKLLLEQCEDTKISIEQYVNAREDRAREILDFVNLLDIMGHPCYSFFFSPHRYAGGPDFYNVYGNVMVALKCDRAGNQFTDVITFHTEESFTVLYNIPGEDAYQFNQHQFQALRMQHNPVKAPQCSRFDLEGMLAYSKRLLEMDSIHSLFSIRPDISLCMVPPDIVKTTIGQRYPIQTDGDQALYNQYMEVARQRHQLFLHADYQQRYIFSKAGMLRFLNMGTSKANVFGFRDLTQEERLEVLHGMLGVAKQNATSTFHMLKNELRYNQTSYLLYGSDTLLIDNYSEFRNYDVARSYHSCWVHTPYITECFASFITNDLLPQYTYTNDETVAFLESLLP